MLDPDSSKECSSTTIVANSNFLGFRVPKTKIPFNLWVWYSFFTGRIVRDAQRASIFFETNKILHRLLKKHKANCRDKMHQNQVKKSWNVPIHSKNVIFQKSRNVLEKKMKKCYFSKKVGMFQKKVGKCERYYFRAKKCYFFKMLAHLFFTRPKQSPKLETLIGTFGKLV